MNDTYKWVVGARPKTLPAAVVPVLVGTAIAVSHDAFDWLRALLALVVSLALQIGVNYANDYSDGIKGTDEVRTGPIRLVGSKLASPKAVKRAAFSAFAVAAAAGIWLCALSSWWLLVLGALSIAAAWFYTGGKRPYGYRGFGELAVFAFFGFAAVMGTTFAQTERFVGEALVASVPVGLLAVALLVVNNLRDRENDAATGKRTMAVILGDKRTRSLYTACVYLPFVIALIMAVDHWLSVVVVVAIPVAAGAVRMVNKGATGRALITVLQRTARLQLVFGVLFAIGLAL